MLTYTRSWQLNRYVDAGWVISGGQIDREFDLKTVDGTVYKSTTKALVAPLTGPMLTVHWGWVGIALGYAAFWADTDITMKNDAVGTLTGNKKGWGSGLYSPLLVLDFYDQRHDLVFGFGLGGYFGTTYPNLEASGSGLVISTDESPIDTLTFHVRCLWGDGRSERRESSSGL